MADLLSTAPACRRYSLRARDVAQLAAVTGLTLPEKIGETREGVAMLGPDEWLALLPQDSALPMGEGHSCCVVDVSERSVGFIVEGAEAVDVLSAGCPLDLARWPIGRASRTIFELVEVVIIREAETRFRVEVWRSFAPWLWEALQTAARTVSV